MASIHQDGFERDAAATIAAGFAEAFAPGATVEGVLKSMQERGAQEVRRLVSMAMDLARDACAVDAFVEGFYATMLDRSFPLPPGEAWEEDRSSAPISREVLPAVVGIFYLCEGDPDRCIVEGSSLGRDADTIATLSGGLAGALRGASAIRADWIEQCERANEEFFAEVEADSEANFRRMAQRLVGAVESEKLALRERLDTLSRITRREGD